MAVKAQAAITLSTIRDLQSCTRYYLLQSSTSAAPSKPTAKPPGSGWATAEPAYSPGSTTSLYIVDLNVFTDGSYAYSDVSLSSSYEAAKAAYNMAVTAEGAASSAQESIDNLQVGGRNLLINSSFSENADKWDNWGTPTTREVVMGAENRKWVHLVTTADRYQGYA